MQTMDDALWRAALLTVPSVLWIYVRFFNIFRQRYHIISHHTKTGGVRMATHLAAGVILLLVLPLLAFLCIPPFMRPRTWLSDCSSICDSILIITGLLLLALNISTLWLVPHPKRHGEYRSKLSNRGFAMSLSIIHATNFQFLAMTASAFAVMCHIWLLKVYLFGVVLLLYLASLMICIGELNSYAWEENTFLKEKIFPFMPYGPLSKSNMIGGVGEFAGERPIFDGFVSVLVAVGGLGLFQVSFQMLQSLFPNFWPPPTDAVQAFFPILVVYMTLVMDAGFFTWTQSMSMSASFWGDIILTQVMPTLVTVLGYSWVVAAHGEASGISFIKEHLLWTRRYS